MRLYRVIAGGAVGLGGQAELEDEDEDKDIDSEESGLRGAD